MRTEDGGEAATDPRYAAAMAQAERLRSDLAAVRGRGTSAEGSVTAVVGASGALLELEIDLGVPACDGRAVAQRVLDACARATQMAQQRAHDVIDAGLPDRLQHLAGPDGGFDLRGLLPSAAIVNGR
jgi:YbaB/EbfC DNA-binding family